MAALTRWIFVLLSVGLFLVATDILLAQNPPLPTEAKADYDRAPVSEMIDLLGQLSGKHYVLDGNLFGMPPISVNATGLNKEDEINLITGTLLLNGVALIPIDEHTAKVVTCGTNKNPRDEGLRLYTNADDLPKHDEIVTYYMALDHLDPKEAAGIFTQVAPVHAYGAYVPVPSTQGVILTENVSTIRELIDLKKSIDVRRAQNRPQPPPDREGGPGPPPPHHPLHDLFGLFVFILIGVFGIAAGNVLAHHWLNRKARRSL